MAITRAAMTKRSFRRFYAKGRKAQRSRKMRHLSAKLPRGWATKALKGLSKTVKTQAKYAAGPEFAKTFRTKGKGTQKIKSIKMINNVGMFGKNKSAAAVGRRTSSRLAGLEPEHSGLQNTRRIRAPLLSNAISMNNVQRIIAKQNDTNNSGASRNSNNNLGNLISDMRGLHFKK